MGEILKDFALKFNGSIRLEEREERLTAEAGALLLREVDERLGYLSPLEYERAALPDRLAV
jgi:hypothetical protein